MEKEGKRKRKGKRKGKGKGKTRRKKREHKVVRIYLKAFRAESTAFWISSCLVDLC
jgi:hypothetical protein